MNEIDNLFESINDKKSGWQERQIEEKKTAHIITDNKSLDVGSDFRELLKYLDIQRRFEMYSVANCLLIQAQKPDATYIRDMRSWLADGFRVDRTSNSILILEPTKPKLQEDGTSIIYYNPKRVYDISATNAVQKQTNQNYSAPTIFKALGRSSPLEIKASNDIGEENKVAKLDESKKQILVKTGNKVEDMIQEISTELSKYYLKLANPDETNLTFKAQCVSYMFCKKYEIPFRLEKMEKLKLDGTPKEIRDELAPIRDTYSTLNLKTLGELEKTKKSKDYER